MQIITGSTNFDNVTSNADASKHLGMIGAHAVALNIGRKLEAAVGQTNNEVRIYDGEGFAQGIHFRVDPGTYDSVEIENGETDVSRTDLIVCRYQIDNEGYESTKWVTIKGAAGGAVPSYQQGSVRDESGDVIDVPFYKVELSGLSITKVTPLYSVLMTWAEMQNLLKTKTITWPGSKVFSVPASNVIKVLTEEEIKKIIGVEESLEVNRLNVHFTNGDYASQSCDVIGTHLLKEAWYATLNRNAKAGLFRFNYTIVYRGR